MIKVHTYGLTRFGIVKCIVDTTPVAIGNIKLFLKTMC